MDKDLIHLLDTYIDENNYDYSIAILINKKLKALEIIKKNIKLKVNYSIGVNRISYFIETQEDIIPITEEEYNLLKEILC